MGRPKPFCGEYLPTQAEIRRLCNSPTQAEIRAECQLIRAENGHQPQIASNVRQSVLEALLATDEEDDE